MEVETGLVEDICREGAKSNRDEGEQGHTALRAPCSSAVERTRSRAQARSAGAR